MASDRPLLRVITAAYPSPAQPQRARFIEELHVSLSSWFRTEVLAPRVDPSDPKSEERHGVLVHRFDYGAAGQSLRESGAGVWRKLRFLWSMRREAQRLWPQDREDGLVVGHWVLPSGSVAARVARRLNQPCVLYGHGTDLHTLAERTGFGSWAGRLIRNSAETVVVSRDLARRAARVSGLDASLFPVVPMAVSDPFFEDLEPREECRDHGRLRLLFVGEFVASKGVPELAWALARLKQQGVPIELEALGRGQRADLLSDLKLGRVTSAASTEVAEAMRRADLLVLPTRAEGTPLVVQEAIVSRLPVLAPPVGGIPDLYRERPGWIPLQVDESNGMGLGAALERDLKDLASRRDSLVTLQRNMKQHEVESFRWSSRVKPLVDRWTQLARAAR